jgi:peptidoglycan-associated lipoprotein
MATIRITGSALRLTLIASAAVSLAACASHPKPSYPATTPPPVAQQAPEPPARGPSVPPRTAPVTQSALPGSERDFAINIGDRVYFDYDSYAVRGDAGSALDAQTSWLKRYPAVQVRIEGNCDERGTQEYNLALGARRANAVREYLVAHGIAAGRISTVSFGKEKPMDPGTGESADQHNRNARTAIVSGARMQ